MNSSSMRENKRYLTRLGSQWGGLHLDMNLIPTRSLVISGGLAHDISLDLELINNKDCFIIGVDPTPVARKTIFRYHVGNFSKRKHFKLIKRAIHGKTGLTVNIGGQASTFLSPQGLKARTLSLDDLVSTYPGASVVKLDIEGSEFPAIEGLTTKLRAPQIAIGFHVWLNSDSDQYPNEGVPRAIYTKDDVLEAVTRIKGMGYKLVYEEREHPERIGQETLFIRKEMATHYQDIDLED